MITDWQMVSEPPLGSPALLDPRARFAAEPAVNLSGERVLVLGCGSGGGLGAWALASAGVGTLTIIDCDRLEAKNLRRHVCGSSEVGEPKATAVARFLRDRFPALAVEPHDLDALERPDDLRERLAECAAVLVAVDDEGPKHLIDAMARELGRPAVFVGVYGGGWAGEVILSDSTTRTPCYACAARALGRVGIPIFPTETGPDYALPAPEVPASDWVRADATSLMPVAALAVRVLVGALARAAGSNQLLAEFTTDGTAWRLPIRAVPEWSRTGTWRLIGVPCEPACRACR